MKKASEVSLQLKRKKRIIKYFRGTHERFKDLKINNLEYLAKDFINHFFDSLEFDEDEQIIRLVLSSYNELQDLLIPQENNYEIYKFLKLLHSLYSVEYTKIITNYYK